MSWWQSSNQLKPLKMLPCTCLSFNYEQFKQGAAVKKFKSYIDHPAKSLPYSNSWQIIWVSTLNCVSSICEYVMCTIKSSNSDCNNCLLISNCFLWSYCVPSRDLIGKGSITAAFQTGPNNSSWQEHHEISQHQNVVSIYFWFKWGHKLGREKHSISQSGKIHQYYINFQGFSCPPNSRSYWIWFCKEVLLYSQEFYHLALPIQLAMYSFFLTILAIYSLTMTLL